MDYFYASAWQGVAPGLQDAQLGVNFKTSKQVSMQLNYHYFATAAKLDDVNVLPVDTELTQYAGDITIRLTFTKTDMEARKVFVVHTGELVIKISPLKDYYSFVPDESLEFVSSPHPFDRDLVRRLHGWHGPL